MRDTVWEQIKFFLVLWAVLFLLLCVISVIINWSSFIAAIGGTISSIFVSLAVIVVLIYLVVLLIRPR